MCARAAAGHDLLLPALALAEGLGLSPEEGSQVAREGAIVGVPLQAARHELGQPVRDARRQGPEVRRHVVSDGPEAGEERRAGVGRLAAQTAEQERAQAVDVGPSRGREVAVDLLRAEEVHAREGRLPGAEAVVARLDVEAEPDQANLPVESQEDMSQGQVAVNEVDPVHAGQGLAELDSDGEAQLQREGPGVGLQDLSQVGGVEVLLDEPASRLAVLREVVAGEEVGFLQPEQALAVLEEAGLALAVLGRVDHAQDREPGQLAVAPPPRAIDADLPALGQALFELEARDREGQGGRSSGSSPGLKG